ncbi:Vgb family protein [Streptomyces marispadix]|uniref:Prolow-density lipoprotein receptor-related protein 1-like beta-propeller domain-containing protein n=1 Tax=Streptomyces marispadix TaxID=2922868 RepID=A0ABS9SXC9_9ACTN|nr:hypothetical protein [Streptomyces marispadix]MCH6160843.1 hypothetical protein [Streptomyces marispadix]
MQLFTRNRPGARRPAAAGRAARPGLTALAAMTVAGIALGGAAPAYAAEDADPAAADTSVSCPSEKCRQVFDRTDATDVDVDSTGRNLYITDSSGEGTLYRKNLDTGETKRVATGIGWKTVLADDDTAYNVAWGDDKVRRIDLTTGNVDVVTTLSNPTDIELDGKGNAYISTAQGSHKLYRLDLATKKTTEVADGSYYMHGVALDHKGHAYVSEIDSGGHLYEVDLSDNTKREIPGGAYHDVVITGSGQAYGVRTNGELHRIDLADGTTEKVATGMGSAVSIRSDRAGGVFVAARNDGQVWHFPDLEAQDTKVALDPVSHITAVPGGPAVPRLKVTNTGNARIGNQDVTLKLGPEGVKWGFNVVYQDRDGNLVETPCHVVDGDAGTSLCKDVPLNLDPGQSVELRTEVNTDKSLKPGDMPSITWHIADQSAKTDWLMK